MRLNKSAYGLVRAPRNWWITVNESLLSLGFVALSTDKCCWILRDAQGEIEAIVTAHVDDFLFGGRGNADRMQKRQLQEQFKWGSWEEHECVQCGINILQLPDTAFNLINQSLLNVLRKAKASLQNDRDRRQTSKGPDCGALSRFELAASANRADSVGGVWDVGVVY